MIPKIIHYCWFGGNPLPRTARKCISTWEKKCPGYEIIRWDETNFNVRQDPFVSSAYDAGAWAFVSDWARLKVIYDHGGVYLDTDVELIRPLDSLLDAQFYIGVQQDRRLCTTGLGFGAVESNPVIMEMIRQYSGMTFDWSNSRRLACPYLNDQVVRAHGFSGDGMGEVEHIDGLVVYPCRFLDPISPGDSLDLLCSDTISISHYSHSWGTDKEKLKRSLINAVGTGRVQAIKKALRHGRHS